MEQKNTKKCPYCGEEIQAEAKKCRFCGEWLPVEKAKIPCPICGEEIDEDTTICPYCNERIKEETTISTPSVITPSAENHTAKKNWKVIGIAAFAVIAVVAVGWAIFSSNSESANNKNSVVADSKETDTIRLEYLEEQPATGDIDDYEVGDYEAMKNNYKSQWEVRYLKDAFGDEDRNKPAYTIELDGTTNLIEEGEPCRLGIIVHKPKDCPVPLVKFFLIRKNGTQNFFHDTQLYFKLNDGKKIQMSCEVEDGDLWIGNSIEEKSYILDLFEEGYFTIAIKSENIVGGDRMNCIFESGLKTTGIKKYFQ